MSKNWLGNTNSIFKTLGASNHTVKEREILDYYATDPKAIEVLLSVEDFDNILEPACGEGHLSQKLIELGKIVTSSDIIDRGYGITKDFFTYTFWDGDIITNPPYRYALDFAKHGLKIIPEGRKMALFLKLQFLEGKQRKKFFLSNPFKVLYVSSSRLLCAKNAKFDEMVKGGGSAVAYGWYVWEKGFKGDPIIKWVN